MRRQLDIGGVRKADLLARLHAAGVRLNPLAEALFADERFVTSPRRSQVEVVQVTPRELGLPAGATFAQVVARASDHGLHLCPLELGPHLRLAWADQCEVPGGQPQRPHCAPPGSVTVASPELCESEVVPKGFYLRRMDGGLWLRGYRSWSGHLWSPDDAFVFSSAECGA